MTLNKCLFLFLFLFLSIPSFAAGPLKATIDPTELATGARPLGMGRAYVGIADDANSLFQNPAGLCQVRDWQATSMYSKLIEEVDYSLLGITRSLSREALGIGYVSAMVGGSQLTKRDPVTDRIVPDSTGFIGYSSSVLSFAYAVSPEKYFTIPYISSLNLGGSIKVFNQALTGIPTADVSALGFDLDLGLQYKPYSYLTLALSGYNVLPYNLGGRLMWGSGITESIPASGKLGAAFKVFGKGSYWENRNDDYELLLSYDYEFTPQRIRPQLSHLGLEWKKAEIVSVRLGVDQDAVSDGVGGVGVNNNLSAGLGLTFFNLRFDYAFHTFGELANNNTHFVSLSYGIEKEKAPAYVPPEPVEFFAFSEPADKYVSFDPYIIIKGKLLEPKKVAAVKVNDESSNLYQNGTFMQVVPLKVYGINKLDGKAYGLTGRLLETRTTTVIRLKKFKDIKPQDPLREKIGALAVLGYISGTKDERFLAGSQITRGGLIDIMVKTGKAAMVVKGYEAEALKMKAPLTRDEAVTMLVNFAGIESPSRIYEKPFPDIPVNYWAAKKIHAAKSAGLLEYLKGKKFNPKLKVTRYEIIEMLSRIGFIKEKIDALTAK